MNRKRRIFFETQEVVQRTKRGYVDLEMDYFQFYSAAFSHVASLSSSCSKDFILWVMGKVNEDNSFIYSQQMFKEFNQDLAKIQKQSMEKNEEYPRPDMIGMMLILSVVICYAILKLIENILW